MTLMTFYVHGKEIDYSNGEVWDEDEHWVFPPDAERNIREIAGCRCPKSRCKITGNQPFAFEGDGYWYGHWD